MNVLHIEVQDILLLGHLKAKEVKYNFEKKYYFEDFKIYTSFRHHP